MMDESSWLHILISLAGVAASIGGSVFAVGRKIGALEKDTANLEKQMLEVKHSTDEGRAERKRDIDSLRTDLRSDIGKIFEKLEQGTETMRRIAENHPCLQVATLSAHTERIAVNTIRIDKLESWRLDCERMLSRLDAMCEKSREE